MRKWKVFAAVLAVAFVAPTVMAQDPDMQRELEALKAEVAAMKADKAQSQSAQDEALLESQINAVSERYAAGTTVKSAANPVTLSGEFRFRSSWSFGDNLTGTTPAGPFSAPFGADTEHDGSWTDALVRLGFQYDFTRDVTAYAELQAHWAFGDGASTDAYFFSGGGTQGGSNAIEGFGSTNTTVRAHQAWLEVRNLFDRPEFSSRTGRQEIVFGNQFQFGNADWYNGFAFDGSRWDWDSESFSLTALVLKLSSLDGDFFQTPSFRNSHDDDELYGLYFTLKTIKNHALDVYWLYVNGHGGAFDNGSGVSNGSLGNFVGDPLFIGTAYWHTVGARIGGVFPDVAAGLDWNLEGAYQFGDNKGVGFELDIDAFALEAELGITFNKESMFRIYARFLWAEGPEQGELGYITLYPTRHMNGGFRARYGLFDIIPMTNVVTPQVGIHFDPDPAWTLGLTALWATTDQEIIPGGGGDGDDYGWEVDVWAEYRYSDHLIFNAGVAFLWAEQELQGIALIDDDTQFYGYLQARLLF